MKCTYGLYEVETRLVKIAVTDNLIDRIYDRRKSSTAPFGLLFVVPGDWKRVLWIKFKHLRVDRMWFDDSTGEITKVTLQLVCDLAKGMFEDKKVKRYSYGEKFQDID